MAEETLVFPMDRTNPLVPPAAYFEALQGPPRRVTLHSGERAWLVSRYDQVRALLTDRRVGADHSHPDFPHLIPVPHEPGSLSIMRMDPPEHTRLRRMLAQEFTARRVAEMRPGVQRTVDDLLDAMTPPADLVDAFTMPLPSLVICQLLGVPYSDHAFFQEQSRRITAMDGPEQGAAAMVELAGYLEELTASKERTPSDDLLGRLATRFVNTGALSHEELVAMARLLLIGGHETTANALGLAVFALLRQPGQWAALRDGPDLVAPAVEELLRYLSVIQGLDRVALADIDLDGHRIARGDALIIGILSPNFDPAVFPDGATLDVRRETRQHLAFGYGSHQCIGAALARLELDAALSTLLARFPDLRLAAEPADIPFRTDMLIFGPYQLPVVW